MSNKNLLLAIAVDQSTSTCMTDRHREQARSHRGSLVLWKSAFRPAPDHLPNGVAIAGKPAPTGIWARHRVCEQHRSIVGASLLAMRPAHSTRVSGRPRCGHRRQASSHIGSGQGTGFVSNKNLLLAIAVDQSTSTCMTDRHREQARSHRGSLVLWKSAFRPAPDHPPTAADPHADTARTSPDNFG